MANLSDDTPTTGNPYLDSLIWGGKWVADADDLGGLPEITYYFASGPDDPLISNLTTAPWSQTQTNAFDSMLQLYANVANITFRRVDNESEADDVERLTVGTHPYLDGAGGAHEIPDPFNEQTGETLYYKPLLGYYNTAVSTLANPTPGSFGFMLFVHEFGHALGLAHPHDGGGEDGQVFPGVTPNDPDGLGFAALNQGIWTVMSYNDGWTGRPPVSSTYGFERTPMAFDIAALQVLYGANTSYHTSDDTYALPTINGAGAGWACIWDAGGKDTISAAGAAAPCFIDLNAATLQTNDPNAAGVVSSVSGIIGGFTIANGVVIENATGGNGSDYLRGNAANNVLNGGAGADDLDGRAGVDTLIGGTGNDVYTVDDPLERIEELAGGGVDRVAAYCDYALPENVETLFLYTTATAFDAMGNASNNRIEGNNNSNRIDGGAGADTLFGYGGDDTYVVDSVHDFVMEFLGGGRDTVESTISYTLGAEVESLVLRGDGAINGTGNALDNALTGNTKNNILDGKVGADTMAGGAGDDTYIVDNEKDATDETGDGGSSDLVKSAAGKYTLGAEIEGLTLTGAAVTGFGNDIANVIIGTMAANNLGGLGGDDSLSGDKGNDTLDSGNNDDTLDGGAGADSMSGGAGNDVYRIDIAGDQIDGTDAGTDTIESMITFVLGAAQENLKLLGTAALSGTGNDVANIITGNAGANILDGKGGVDDLNGAAGNDTYIVDSSSDKVTEADKGGTDLVKSSQSFTLGDFVENLTLLPGSGDIDGKGNGLNNVITGNEGDNALSGGAGNDTLSGGVGDDTLDGGTGDDMMTGGDGDDVYEVDSATDKVTESSATGGRDEVESAITYTLGANVEDLTLTGGDAISGTGNALDNLLVGGSGANTLDGKVGADTMQGGLGDDTYVIDSPSDRVDENGGGGSDTIQIATAIDLDSAPAVIPGGIIENVTLTGTAAIAAKGSALANELTGNSGANTLEGRAGADTLDGLGGADVMIGGEGNDTYVVDNAKDSVQETGPDAADRINAFITIDLALYGNIEDVTLLGTGALNATGDKDKNHLTGNTGANILDGGNGDDTLAGDKGNDTYKVDSSADLVVEVVNGGTDTVLSTAVSYTLTDANVENLTLLGAAALIGIGNGGANKLTGNDFANTLDGGVGADTLVGGKADDLYRVDDAKDVVTEAAGAGTGTDTVESTATTYILGANVENLKLMGMADLAGTGNALDNTLTGNAGANALDGKAGQDHMIGGVGNDGYVVDNIGDVVDELGGNGADTVNSSISFSLANVTAVLGTVEHLTLTGAGALTGTGNDIANRITGNAGANALFGRDGADTIDGGGGNDTVAGEAGDDHIDVATGNDTVRYISILDGHDVIDAFDGSPTGGQDVLDLDGLFDKLSLSGSRESHVDLVANGAGVDIRVDADGNAANGFELVVATLNLANSADAITVGQDVVVGS